MGELPLHEEESLRIGAPRLYERMMEAFSKHRIHPFDTEGKVVKKKDRIHITLTLAGSTSPLATKEFTLQQAKEPDQEVISFFEGTAEECKNLLIKNYYKMIKL